jgi:rhodanese-related sulfurtransferase
MNQNFSNLGFIIEGLRHLSPRQAYECCLKGAIIVDIREDYEIAIKDFGITGKLFCPYTEFEKLFRTLPKDKPLIIADCVGIHSKAAARLLLENGYSNVANMAGGIADWERDGLPMKKDIEIMGGQCPCQIKSRPL